METSTVADNKAPKIDPVKYVAKINGNEINVFVRTATRGRAIGKETLSIDESAINAKNYNAIFNETEFFENFVHPNLRKLGSAVSEEACIRDSAGKITTVDQVKWNGMFFEKVSAVSETIKALKAKKDELWDKLMAITPPTAEQMPEFIALAEQVKQVNSDIEDKQNG